MPLLGSDGGFQADNRGGLIDELGNTVVSSSTTFAASPLGVAARTQALYGIPNATFNLTPPDPAEPIVANQNDLPYWSIENLSDGQITATTVFDSTTQTWGVELNPGTAASGASLSLSTRSYLITDDNLALRQKAQAVLAKSGTAAVSTQWNLSLNAIYYDANDTALSTAIIGTVYDTGTWTSLAGTTTPGGSAINAAAQYVDLTFTMTTTAAVTGSAKATIKSLLLNTSSAASGSFLVTEFFTANATWTRPTGVTNLVAIVACGGGGGGGSGELDTTGYSTNGGGGGGGGAWAILKDVAVDQATYSIGVGAGGTGGTAMTFSKASGSNATSSQTGVTGASGGSSSFGSLFSVSGGAGGQGGQGGDGGTGGSGTNSFTSEVWLPTSVKGGDGGKGAKDAQSAAVAGGNGGMSAYSVIPYSVASAAGSAGANPSGTGGTITQSSNGGSASTVGWIGGGGGGGGVSGTGNQPGALGARGGGSGGGAVAVLLGANVVTRNAGNGGNAGGNVGAGGGGGGSFGGSGSSSSGTYTLSSGAGGNGAGGFVAVVYVA